MLDSIYHMTILIAFWSENVNISPNYGLQSRCEHRNCTKYGAILKIAREHKVPQGRL